MPPLRKAAGAVGSMIKTGVGAVQKGVGAVKKAVGQTAPTADEAHAYLAKKGVSINTINKLKELRLLPHTKMSASSMGFDSEANREKWEKLLTKSGVNRLDRFPILKELVQADIGAWMPLINSDSFR